MVVNLGDILSGPLLPCETADRLMALDLPTIRGNHERQLLAPDRDAMGLSDRHAAESITGPQREWLSKLPATMWLAGEVFLVNSTPESDGECVLADIPHVEWMPAARRGI